MLISTGINMLGIATVAAVGAILYGEITRLLK